MRVVNYTYDMQGRMTTADYRHGTGLGGSQKLAFPLALTDVNTLDTRLAYDANGRITGKRSGGISSGDSAIYHYYPDSYRVERVTGKLSGGHARVTSGAMTFQYDTVGNMVRDTSKRLAINYGNDGMPTLMSIDSSLYLRPLYDASGQRVSEAVFHDSATGTPLLTRHWVNLGGQVFSEVSESYDTTSGYEITRMVVPLYGRGAQIGRVVHTDTGEVRQYFVKNHLGSTMRVVNVDGSYATTPTFDYQAYGEPQVVREDSLSGGSPRYTGKELDAELNLYYFGARWYDAELGMWMGTDPARDGLNPYGYVGGNPIIFIDPYGLWKIGLGISIGYTRKGGFSLGFGIGLEDVELPGLTIDTYAGADRNFGNGSTSYSAQAGGKVCVGVCLGAGAGASYNTQSGYSANGHGSVGVGLVGVGDVGVEVGTNQYWDKSFDWIGGDVYGEGYLSSYGTRAGLGYSQGMGAIRSGGYGELSAGGMSVSYHSAYGLDYGGSTRVASASYNSKQGFSYNYVGKSLVDYLSSEKTPLGQIQDGSSTGLFGTNWCGSGGGGAVTSFQDGGCLTHDKRYAAAGVEGLRGLLTANTWQVIAADFELAGNSFQSVNMDQSALGHGMGSFFTVLGAYKTITNLTTNVPY